jgi:multidrug efflux pump subunit AcrB
MNQTQMTTLIAGTVRTAPDVDSRRCECRYLGAARSSVHVLVDPDRLRDYKLTLDEIIRITRDATMPAAGGFVETPNQRLSVTHVAAVKTRGSYGRAGSLSERRAARRSGKVADVTEGHQAPIGDAVINEGQGSCCSSRKQLGANPLAVTRDVEKTIEQLRPGLKDIELDTTIFRPATFIEMSLTNLRDRAYLGLHSGRGHSNSVSF